MTVVRVIILSVFCRSVALTLQVFDTSDVRNFLELPMIINKISILLF